MPRAKEFEPEAALDAAMHLFWEKGYGATSVQDLVERMGINRFSLYDTFGDKHALYLATIERYRKRVTGQLLDLLDEADGLGAIQNHFHALAEALSSPMGRVGCLVQNSALELAVHDPEVAARTRETNDQVEAALYRALCRAREAGALRARRDLRGLARHLFAVGQGMIVMSKASADASAVRGEARFVIEEVESWR